jgi:hypothetical protein
LIREERVVSTISLPLTIVVRAQHAVDRWVKTRNPVLFDRYIATVSEQLWGSSTTVVREQETFRLVAGAIRRGHGHAFADPAPLLAMAERVLGYGGPMQTLVQDPVKREESNRLSTQRFEYESVR